MTFVLTRAIPPNSERQQEPLDHQATPGAFTITPFCEHYHLSRAKVYSEIAAGRLTTMKIGSRTLISFRAALDWERLCEQRETR
jgi:hypothetical protein